MHDYVAIDSTMILSSIPSILKPMEDTGNYLSYRIYTSTHINLQAIYQVNFP